MASTKTLNAKNLEALGSERLAALLMEVATGDAGIKRRLRLALAGEAGPADAAREITKRLATIAKARSFIDWHKVKPLAADLAAQHGAIMNLVAPHDPAAALDLLWRLAGCAEPVFARSDDGSGRLADMFRAAVDDLGPVADAARIAPAVLAERAFEAVKDDGYGTYDGLVETLAPALGTSGLERLRDLGLAWQAQPVAVSPQAEREVIGWGSGGPMYADQINASQRTRASALLLQHVADALGDVDAYIAQYEPETRRVPLIAARIAERLLAAGRTADAWAAIEASESGKLGWLAPEWEQARLKVLDALGRHDDAQDYRWERFVATLNSGHLRAFLKKLPDFEDFDAEQRAIAHARGHADVHRALAFLVAWPALDRAAALVVERADAIDGNAYELLTPAAKVLEEKHPLAATILRRAMIDYTLSHARASRYGHAARHLVTCGHLARRIADCGKVADHDTYLGRLREDHGRKAGFWREVVT
ncbi:DUF6880 family protein [uncultured Sphingomonas sp.]|uniref:DUF6880 family protein n=1 Tax=uncultured Sphingomonas sp. TaxID=158754 RepID=UPI0035CB9E45